MLHPYDTDIEVCRSWVLCIYVYIQKTKIVISVIATHPLCLSCSHGNRIALCSMGLHTHIKHLLHCYQHGEVDPRCLKFMNELG